MPDGFGFDEGGPNLGLTQRLYKSQPIIIIARLLSSEPWSLERFQVYSPEGSRHGYLISRADTVISSALEAKPFRVLAGWRPTSRKAREVGHPQLIFGRRLRRYSRFPRSGPPVGPYEYAVGFTSTRSTGIAGSTARSPTLRWSRLVCLHTLPSNPGFASHRCRRAGTTD